MGNEPGTDAGPEGRVAETDEGGQVKPEPTNLLCKTREHWEEGYAMAQEIMRGVVLRHEARTLGLTEIMDLREEAATQLQEAFDFDEIVTPAWIEPLVTDEGVFVGMTFRSIDQFFSAVTGTNEE